MAKALPEALCAHCALYQGTGLAMRHWCYADDPTEENPKPCRCKGPHFR